MAAIVQFLLVQGGPPRLRDIEKKDTKSQLCAGELTICKLLIWEKSPLYNLHDPLITPLTQATIK